MTSNGELSQNRTDAIYRYLINNCSTPNFLITVRNCGVAWDLIREYVVDSETEYKIEVVEILDKVPVETWERVEAADRWQTLVDSRNKHLMDLRYGRPYNQMYRSIFPYLRKSSIEVIYARKEIEPAVERLSKSIMIEESLSEQMSTEYKLDRFIT